MPTAFDKTPTDVDVTRRFARLAVSWYGVDADRVEEVVRAVLVRQEQGEDVHILEALVAASIITEHQAESLRIGQAPTQMDVNLRPDGSPRMPATILPGATPPSMSDSDEPVQIGPYRLLRRLGVGGMGAVYLAYDSKENRQVAIKVLAAEQAPKQGILRRFQLEAQHGASLAHPNIVRSYDTGRDTESGLHYIVLEYVDGPTAHDLLEVKGMLDVGDAVHIILDIARGLEYAHKKRIIHRDIKPGNILLASSGLAKLSDLGLAKNQGDAHNLTHASQGIGTPYYMPYEQAMNARMADERSDIYALGATLFHLITGEVPFGGETSLDIVEKKRLGDYPRARSLNPKVPDALDAILMRMLKRDPDDRYQTISEVIVELERSSLSAAIPSFVTLDSALQDPVVRKRLTKPIEATQPDLRLPPAPEEPKEAVWIVRYRDAKGRLCKATIGAAEVIKRLKAGRIPLNADASMTSDGKFKPIAKWPQFAKTVAALRVAKEPVADEEEAEVEPAKSRRVLWLWIAIGTVGLGVIATLIFTLTQLLRGA